MQMSKARCIKIYRGSEPQDDMINKEYVYVRYYP